MSFYNKSLHKVINELKDKGYIERLGYVYEHTLKKKISEDELYKLISDIKKKLPDLKIYMDTNNEYHGSLLVLDTNKAKDAIIRNEYINWRVEGESSSKLLKIPFTWDCGEASAREDFSSYANLEVEISFEKMLKLEREYNKGKYNYE